MTPERPTFSPLWHRVRALKPRLRPHVQITRQFYRGRRWHVVHDPASNQFYRLSPVAHELVGLLDGSRTVEEGWNISLETHGDAAPTQGEVIEMLGQMYSANLLAVDVTPETEQLLSRGRERVKRRLASQAIGIMYFKVRLFNPDRYLSWLTPILKPLINPVGFVLWCAWVAWGLTTALGRWDDLKSAFNEAISPEHWLGLWAVFLVIKAIHETGHGVICKRFGGQVPEFGAMLLVLLPSPYVDASSAWGFSSKWRRAAVGAGGMIFELAVAAAAAHYWAATQQGTLGHRLAFNAMFTASVTTVLFNANPLMRFDGYYILSDLIEVPNLMQRSMRMLQHLAQKYIYRVERTRPPSTVRSEQVILVVYGVLAMIYRVFLFISITLYMLGKLFAIGLLLAIWTAVAWFAIPAGKFVHWIATGPQIAEHRARAILTSVAIAAILLIGTGAIPLPDNRRAAGVVESVQSTGVFFKAPGFIARAHVRAGDRVRAGDPIVTCENPDLEASLRSTMAQLAEYEAIERQYIVQNAGAAQLARTYIQGHRERARVTREWIDGLVVRAPHDGVVVLGTGGIDPAAAVGAYVEKGQMLCEIVDTARCRVAAAMGTAEAEPVLEQLHTGHDVRAQIRAYRKPEDELDARAIRVIPAAQRVLPHAALGYPGGGVVETESRDQSGLAAKSAQFIAYLDADGLGLPGERVKVRFRLPWRPLLGQWYDRLRRTLQARVDI